MVSRIHFYCPGCGAEELPVLIQTPYYNCPDCQTITPRDKLDRKRRNNYLLAGAIPSWEIFQATVYRDHQDPGATSATTPSFWVAPGSMVVAIVGRAAGLVVGGLPDSVKLNNTDTMTLVVGTDGVTDPGIGMYQYNSQLTTAGQQAVVVDFTTSQPEDVVITVLVIRGQISGNPVDKTKVATALAFNPSTRAWSTGATTTQSVAGNLAIGAVVGDSLSTANLELTVGRDWNRGQYVNDANVGAPGGVVFMINANQQIVSKNTVTFSGTGSQDQVDAGETFSAVVATFKHA